MVCPTRKRVGKSMPGEAIVLKSSLGFLRSDLFIREGQLKIKLFTAVLSPYGFITEHVLKKV